MWRPIWAATARTSSTVSRCSASVPWEKLTRAMSIPAAISARSVARLELAGPSVQMIRVRRRLTSREA